MPSESDQIVKDLIGKTKSLSSEKEDLNGKVKQLQKKVKELEEEVEDAVASAEAANMGKSAVEKDWTERLVKVQLAILLLPRSYRDQRCKPSSSRLSPPSQRGTVWLAVRCYRVVLTALSALQTEQEWAVKLKKAEEERARQLAAKDDTFRKAGEQHKQALADKDADARAQLQKAQEQEAAALKRQSAEHESSVAQLGELHKGALADVHVRSPELLLVL